MATVTLHRDALRHNYRHLDRMLKQHGVKWGITTKLLCGHEGFLREVLNLGIGEVHDSRISNLQLVKQIDPDTLTIYIKPPPKDFLDEIVRYADISLNTELATLEGLSREATRQGTVHKVIIMIEMGDLREGVMREDLVDFYEKVFRLPGIEVIGLGTNLNCMYGVLPDPDKLIQLVLYKQIIELRFKRSIPLISGGTTVTLPLVLRGLLPAGVNHFRVGEALFFGKDLFSGGLIEGLSDRVLDLQAQIIELSEKPVVPSGELAANPQGKTAVIDEDDYGRTTWRAILDVGVLDILPDYLIPEHEGMQVLDASSDMLIVDLGEDPGDYQVGDTIGFKLSYMGALGLMNSQYIEKRVN